MAGLLSMLWRPSISGARASPVRLCARPTGGVRRGTRSGQAKCPAMAVRRLDGFGLPDWLVDVPINNLDDVLRHHNTCGPFIQASRQRPTLAETGPRSC